MLALSEVKQWLRLEESDTSEDALLQMLIGAAEEYVRGAVSSDVDLEESSRARLLMLTLIADWYEHREATGQVRDDMRPVIRSLVTQLQASYSEEHDGAEEDSE